MLVVAYKENCVGRLDQLVVFGVSVAEPAIRFALLGPANRPRSSVLYFKLPRRHTSVVEPVIKQHLGPPLFFRATRSSRPATT